MSCFSSVCPHADYCFPDRDRLQADSTVLLWLGGTVFYWYESCSPTSQLLKAALPESGPLPSAPSELDGGATIEVKSNVVRATAPAPQPANFLPPPQKQAVRINQRLLQTKDLISHGFIALHCSGSSLKTRDLKSFRLIFMHTLSHTLNFNSPVFNQFCTLSQEHRGGIPPAPRIFTVRDLPPSVGAR
jgi:hypothetical protein